MLNSELTKVEGFELLSKEAENLKAQGLKSIRLDFSENPDCGKACNVIIEPHGFEVDHEIIKELGQTAFDLMEGSTDELGGGGFLNVDFERMDISYGEYYFARVLEEFDTVLYKITGAKCVVRDDYA